MSPLLPTKRNLTIEWLGELAQRAYAEDKIDLELSINEFLAELLW
jgi:hypothetical protein